MNFDDDLALLCDKLKLLRLPGMKAALTNILDAHKKKNLTTLEVLHRLCDEEQQSRISSSIKRRIADAQFPEINTIDQFNFDFDASRKKMRARYLALHDLSFIANGQNPLFIGTPGTGKTFLARSLAHRACQQNKRVVCASAPRMLNELHGAELHGALDQKLRRYLKADLLLIDDFAVLAMDPAQAKLAYHVISERYDYRRSTMITTNRVFKDWPKVFPDALNAEVIAKRLTERSEHFLLDGKAFFTPGS